jgi:sodium transport system permease protein
VNDSGTVRGAVLAIARRDLLEFVRDRRTLFVTLLMPMAMYPVLALSSLLGLRTAVEEFDARRQSNRLGIVVSGADAEGFVERVRGLAARLEQPEGWPEQLEIEPMPPSFARQVLADGIADAWIETGPGTLDGLDGRGTVPLDVRLAKTVSQESEARRQLAAVLDEMAQDARRRRIAAAGMPSSVLEPLLAQYSGGAATGGTVQGVLPIASGAVFMLLALLMATGAFYPAIDAIAGEKERGTIETLLMAPCGPGPLVLGKFLAVFVVTLATLAANLLSIVLTATVLVRMLPAEAGLGIDGAAVRAGVAVALPAFVGLAAVAAALSLAVTAASKSIKEAQNTLTPVILLVSALSGAALLPGLADRGWLAAVPFAGQVALARSVVADSADLPRETGDRVDQPRRPGPLVPLAITLVSSAVLTWLLLRATAAVVTDEEILFRGPDAAVGGLSRPARRRRPTPWQGFGTALAGLAALWYVQGLAPADMAGAVALQQVLAVIVPLAVACWWQRVDLRVTFGLRPPPGGPWSAVAAAVAGGGLFVVGAAVFLALRGTEVSPEVARLSARLVELLRERPWWMSAALIALLPAVAEELLFRGWILSSLAGEAPRRSRAVAAVLLQAVAFAIFHLLPERMPQTFALGVLLGWMTLHSGSLVPAMVGHAAHNAMPLVLLALAERGGAADWPVGIADPVRLPGWLVAAAVASLVSGILAFAVTTAGSRSGDGSVRTGSG